MRNRRLWHDKPREAALEDKADAPGGKLTKSELEVAPMFIEGRSIEGIAEGRGLPARTVSSQLSNGQGER